MSRESYLIIRKELSELEDFSIGENSIYVRSKLIFLGSKTASKFSESDRGGITGRSGIFVPRNGPTLACRDSKEIV